MYITDSIVLNTRESGESDLVVSLYTKKFGKIVPRARSAKSITTKQGNFFHNPAIIQTSFILGRNGSIFSGIKESRAFPEVSRSFLAYAYTTSFFALCDKVIYEEEKDVSVWKTLTSVLEEAEQAVHKESPEYTLWRAEKSWILSLLRSLGFNPDINSLKRAKDLYNFDYSLKQIAEYHLQRRVSFFGAQYSNQNRDALLV